MKVLKYNGARYACPLTDRFRRHSAEERDAMRESIRPPGVIHYPVMLYDDTTLNKKGCVLDGEGRLEVGAEVGADVPFTHAGKLTTEEAYELAKSVNDARRHEDVEELRKRRAERVERVAAKRTAGKSIRAIAEEEGVSVAQTQRDLKTAKSTVPPGTVEPERVMGRDGKERPATRTPPTEPGPLPDPEGTQLFMRSAASIADDLEKAARKLAPLQEIVSVVLERPDLRHLADKATPKDEPLMWGSVDVAEVAKHYGVSLVSRLYSCNQLDQLRDFCFTLCAWLRRHSQNPDGTTEAAPWEQ